MSGEPRVRLVSRASGFADPDLVEIVLAGIVRPNGSLSIEVSRGMRRTMLSLTQGRLLALLATARSLGLAASYEALIEAIWFEDADGGPDDARGTLDVHLMLLRRKILPLGMTIDCVIWGQTCALDVAPAAASREIG